MKINLLSCKAQRPEKRTIAVCSVAFAFREDESSANHLTGQLLEGDEIEIAIRTQAPPLGLPKLKIDYGIIE